MFNQKSSGRWMPAVALALVFGGNVQANSGEPFDPQTGDCTEPTPRYHTDTQELHLTMVRAGTAVYTAHLKLVPGNTPMRFEVTSVRICQNNPTSVPLPSYDAKTGELRLPMVEVKFQDGRIQRHFARLNLVDSHPMTFDLMLLEPAPGELYTVGDTVYVNTLLGYGEAREPSSYPAYNRSAAAGGDILWGSDLGLPVTLPDTGTGEQLTLYLFGDTDQLDLQWLEDNHQVRKYKPLPDELFVGPRGPFEGDAIGQSTDDDPTDGVHLARIYRNLEPEDKAPVCDAVDTDGFRPVYLKDIHASPCVQTLPNTTPTGAWVVDETLFMLAGLQDPDNPSDAKSYLAASTDLGLNWKVINAGQPFSQGGFQAKFIHAFGLPVDALDYQDENRSGPCKLPLASGKDTRGLLLFGAGLWKGSDVYLAFVSRTDLLAAAADDQHRLSPWYFAGTSYTAPDGSQCWSPSETDAKAIIVASDLSAYSRFEDACGTTLTSAGVGYTKVVHVDETLADGNRIDRLVMLLSPAYQGVTEEGKALDADLGTVLVTGDPLRPWIWNLAVEPQRHHGRLPSEHRFRPLPVPADPDHGLEPVRPHCKDSGTTWATVAGYAPLLIDRYTRLSSDGKGVDLYFNISRWKVPKGTDDKGPETVDAYHYVVEVMRTTLRPAP